MEFLTQLIMHHIRHNPRVRMGHCALALVDPSLAVLFRAILRW